MEVRRVPLRVIVETVASENAARRVRRPIESRKERRVVQHGVDGRIGRMEQFRGSDGKFDGVFISQPVHRSVGIRRVARKERLYRRKEFEIVGFDNRSERFHVLRGGIAMGVETENPIGKEERDLMGTF